MTNAGGYRLRWDKDIAPLNLSASTTSHTFTHFGRGDSFWVQVKTIGDNVNCSDSGWSEILAVKQFDTHTPTFTPSNTPTVTNTPTATNTPTVTNTPLPPTATPTATDTPVPPTNRGGGGGNGNGNNQCKYEGNRWNEKKHESCTQNGQSGSCRYDRRCSGATLKSGPSSCKRIQHKECGHWGLENFSPDRQRDPQPTQSRPNPTATKSGGSGGNCDKGSSVSPNLCGT